ncbi:hypothetical protein NESM_000233600 [Novymonas esmeraldas]|uniref:Uncharacterized protein n=1 Tax=Novymonas esmeraldas TaxID=1808958 RepID=A0AAW0F928_9TRYP
MSQRISPLTRNQLLELEALMRALISAVTQQQQQQQQWCPATPASLGEQSWPSSAPSTPASVSLPHASGSGATGLVAPTHGGGGLPSSSCSLGVAPRYSGAHSRAVHQSSSSSTAAAGADHAALRGAFVDVFADPWTAATWRLYDKIEYLVWWSYRPPSCSKCGMQDAWMPSGEVEYQCAFCLSGAGTTRSNAVVEDTAVSKQDQTGLGDSGDEEDHDDMGGPAGGGGGGGGGVAAAASTAAGRGGGGGSGAGGGGPIDAYMFFYEWLQRVPVLGPAGPTSMAAAGARSSRGAGGSGSGAGHLVLVPAPTSYSAREAGGGGEGTVSAPPPPAGRSGGGADGGDHLHHHGSSSGGGGVLLPTGESLPMVLRAAFDMASLLTPPGLPRGGAPSIRAAALYLSLLLHRYVSLFPLFCLAGRAPAAAAGSGAGPTGSREARGAAAAVLPRADVELQWVDVELIGALLGVTAPSFFESTEVSLQHLQNVFTVAAAYGVPSVLWHPGRVPGRVEAMKALKDKLVPVCPTPFAAGGVPGLSPEHTAMIVALELARRVDAQPIAVSSTSPAAAAQNAQRIGLWLDSLGLYPTRMAYRDAHSYHERVAAAVGPGDEGGDDDAAATEHHDTLAAWERSLAELAASKDAPLLTAAEQHACRHDTSADVAAALTTPSSPFHHRFEWIMTSPSANALLHIFAAVFRMTPMELADQALRSGIYQGPASAFVATLRAAVLRGAYDVMPLSRRLSPLTSTWMCTYAALHSGDRLPLLAALHQLRDAQNTTRERQTALTRLLQRILRKQHAAQLHQFNYVLRVTDEVEKHFNGIYILSKVLWQEGLAVFTCLRSCRKTITLNRHTHRLSLCYTNARERHVDSLALHVAAPVAVAVETEATRLIMETALGTGTAPVGGDPWGYVVRCLDKCARVRRRMRVPMLASRLDALASIREQASTAAVQQMQPHPTFLGGAGGQLMQPLGSTLAGWGDTETLLVAAPALDVQQLRRELQWNLLSLPHVSLLAGLSENRVVAMCASLIGLLELIHHRLASSASAPSSAAGPASNWVEELLYVDEVAQQQQEEALVGEDDGGMWLPQCYGSGGGGGGGAAATVSAGWSPPTYRNSRPGTPKLSRSPKSKFAVVSASTNAGVAAPAPSAFAASSSYASSTSRLRGPSPPLAWQPYATTPPSIAPHRSPVLRSAFAAAATPKSHRHRTPPLGSAAVANGGEVGPPSNAGAPRLPLPDLQLAESTADIAKRKSRQHSGARQRPSPAHRGSRRRGRDGEDSGGGEDGSDSDESSSDERDGHAWAQARKGRAVERQRHDVVVRLLGRVLPAYWDVLLGAATDPAAALAPPHSRDGAPEEEDDDDEDGGAVESAAVARNGRQRRPPHHERRSRVSASSSAAPPRPARRGDEGGGGADAGSHARAAEEPPSEALLSHTPVNVFDATECRRRLHRLYVFIGAYQRCKAALLHRAAAGEPLPTPATPPKLPHGGPRSPPRTVAAAAAAAAGTAGVGRSSPVRLSPPPPLLPPTAKPAAGAASGDAALRSPPHAHMSHRPSPSLSSVASSTYSNRSSRPARQSSAGTAAAPGRASDVGVDSDNFALPPSEVAWQAARRGGAAATAAPRTEGQPSSTPPRGRRELAPGADTTRASEGEEEEEQQQRQSRKRLRRRSRDDDDGDPRRQHAESSSEEDEAEEPASLDQQQQQLQQRRKAKKTGRRRRRQEHQHHHNHQQQPQQPAAAESSASSAPSPSRPSSQANSVSPASRSPVLQSQRRSKAESEVKGGGSGGGARPPASPPKQQQRCASPSSSSPSASDSDCDYDADTN